jgi:hypothetical protein
MTVILSVVLYGWETLSLILNEEHSEESILFEEREAA